MTVEKKEESDLSKPGAIFEIFDNASSAPKEPVFTKLVQGMETPCTKTEWRIGRMKQGLEKLLVQHDFKPGDLIQWKDGLKNRPFPGYGDPLIVVEVLQTPGYNRSDRLADDAGLHEPLSLAAGTVDEDGTFEWRHYDIRRFEPYQTPEA